MSANDYLVERATRHAIFTQRFGGGIYNDLKPILRKLRRDLLARMAGAPTEYQAARITALVGEINALIAEAGAQYGKQLELSLTQFARYEAEFQTKMVSSAIATQAVMPTAEALAAVVTTSPTRMVSGVSETIPQMVRRFTSRSQDSVRTMIQIGYTEGMPTNQIAREIARIVSTRTTRQAEALVRTATNHVGAVARETVNRANADVLQGERYSATLDSRTTMTCAGFDGQVFPIGEGPMPPLHYNCRSVRVPEIKDEFRIPGFEGERASVSGPVSAKTTYDGFLRNQSPEFQNEVLGEERAKLFRSGLPVSRFTDDAGRVLSLDDLKAREGMTLN